MRISGKDSALKKGKIGKRLRGGGTSVLVYSVGMGNLIPVISSLNSKKFAVHDSLQKLFKIFFFFFA